MRGQATDPLIVTTGEIADPRPLDLNNSCTQIGKLPRGKRRRNRVFKCDNRDVFEGLHQDLP
ncbi:hypothetical protein D3C72_1981110 [compost metagenome]